MPHHQTTVVCARRHSLPGYVSLSIALTTLDSVTWEMVRLLQHSWLHQATNPLVLPVCWIPYDFGSWKW